MSHARSMLAFDVAGHGFLLDVGRIAELMADVPPLQVPAAPAAVAGLVTWRQRPVPVVNLRQALSLEEEGATPPQAGSQASRLPPDRRRRIIVLEAQGQLLGLQVDWVDDVVAVSPRDLLDDGKAPLAKLSRWTLGCCKAWGRRYLLLDVRPLAALLGASATAADATPALPTPPAHLPLLPGALS